MEVRAKGFRVYLSSLGLDDAEEITRMANDKEVARGLSEGFPHPYEKRDALSFVEAATRQMLNGEGFHFAIRREGDNVLLGVCGGGLKSKWKKCNIGYWLGREHWGNGYAKEATRLMLYFCFNELGVNRVYAEVHDYNERSLWLLKKLGFVEEGRNRESSFFDGKFMDDMMFALLKREYSDRISAKVIR